MLPLSEKFSARLPVFTGFLQGQNCSLGRQQFADGYKNLSLAIQQGLYGYD
jgi:hypothetical protein